mmetsp:Transcript_8017/g.18789  ORF Transcript_8017/g.18789 Transcript_8017/m.18789 type:complete len:294 (+) Transcript_8017:2012-2893(+)
MSMLLIVYSNHLLSPRFLPECTIGASAARISAFSSVYAPHLLSALHNPDVSACSAACIESTSYARASTKASQPRKPRAAPLLAKRIEARRRRARSRTSAFQESSAWREREVSDCATAASRRLRSKRSARRACHALTARLEAAWTSAEAALAISTRVARKDSHECHARTHACPAKCARARRAASRAPSMHSQPLKPLVRRALPRRRSARSASDMRSSSSVHELSAFRFGERSDARTDSALCRRSARSVTRSNHEWKPRMRRALIMRLPAVAIMYRTSVYASHERSARPHPLLLQ